MAMPQPIDHYICAPQTFDPYVLFLAGGRQFTVQAVEAQQARHHCGGGQACNE